MARCHLHLDLSVVGHPGSKRAVSALGGCGKTPIAAIGDHWGPLLILRSLRCAKAPLFHGTTGLEEFFRNLLED